MKGPMRRQVYEKEKLEYTFKNYFNIVCMRQRKEPVMVKLFDVPKIPKTSLKRLFFPKAKKARKIENKNSNKKSLFKI